MVVDNFITPWTSFLAGSEGLLDSKTAIRDAVHVPVILHALYMRCPTQPPQKAHEVYVIIPISQMETPKLQD